MSRRTIHEHWQAFLDQQFSALSLLREARLPGPFLTIYFSTIDVYSSIWSDGEADGARYKLFCERYICEHLPELTSNELWSARCSIVHTASSESRHTKKGVARELMFCWGPRGNHKSLDEFIMSLPNPRKYVGVSFEQLEEALKRGIASFADDINSDPKLTEDCMKRFVKIYAAIVSPSENLST